MIDNEFKYDTDSECDFQECDNCGNEIKGKRMVQYDEDMRNVISYVCQECYEKNEDEDYPNGFCFDCKEYLYDGTLFTMKNGNKVCEDCL